MLPAWCVGVAMALRLTANGQFVWVVLRGRARPNAVTWLLWGHARYADEDAVLTSRCGHVPASHAVGTGDPT